MQSYPNEQSLLQLAAERVANTPDLSPEQFVYFPKNLKEKVLWIKAKRGTLNDATLSVLIGSDTDILDLSECDISDTGLSSIQKCSNLRKIDLNSMQSRVNITNEGIQALSSCPRLSIVYLRRCLNITDISIVSLAKNCLHLRELNLCGCPQISDASLQALGENCPQLASLNAAHTKVTDAGIYQLVSKECAQSLRELDFSDCNIGDESVEAVMMYCTNIRILVIQGVQISPTAREALDELSLRNKMKQLSWTVY